MKRKGRQRTSKSSGRYGLISSLKSHYDDSQIHSNCGSPDTGSKSSHAFSKTPDDTSSESVHSRRLRNNSDGDEYSSQVDYRSRRGKERRAQNENIDQTTFKNFADDYSNESRDHESSLPTALSSEHEVPYDDESTREASSAKDLMGSQNSVFVEPRQPDKVTVDYTTSHAQRKVNKRELKALLKQTKRKPSTVDESVIAAIDELAVHLKDTCVVEMKSTPRRPIPVAPSPPSITHHQPDTPSRRGIGARRGGRRGRGAHRGRGGFSSPNSSASIKQSVLPASWVPLMLPNPLRNPSTLDSTDNENSEAKSKLCMPWLRQLSESRVHRFVMNMRRLLGTLQNPSETSHSPKKCVDLIDLTQETQISSNSPNEKFKQTAALNADVQNPTNLMISGTDINVMNLSTVDHNQQSSISVNRSETPSTNLEPVFSESALPPRSIVSHLARRRGRGKRHRGGFYRGFPGRPSNMGSSELVTKDSGQFMPKLTTPKNKSRVSRELRGLVTWDAVMAEQRKREQEQKELVEKGEPPVFRPAEVALSVVTELIASVEEEDTLTPKLRRTRQSSGSVHSHATHSAVGSETASMQTTVTPSEQIPYEINCRTKPNESLSVIAYSGLSTEVSSVSSENATVLQKSSTTTNRSSTKRPVDGGSRLDATIATTTSVDHSNCEQKGSFSVISEASERNSEMESAACITKYSPISVEQEPLDDSVYQSSVPAKRDLSPRTSPGRRRKRSRHNRLSKTHLPSDDMNLQTEHYIANETLSHGGITTIDSRQQQQQFDLNSPSSSSSLLNTVGKRRRHAHHSAISNTSDAVVAAADDDEEFAQQSVSPLETSISDACDILSTSTPSSLPNNLRRSSSSRHSVLPPRKRYKVGINTSDDADTHMSSILDSDHPTDDCIKSMSDEQPTTDITVVDLTEVVPSTVDVGQLVDNPDTSVVVVKKRGRGRPSRRSLKLEPINKSIATSPCLSSDSVSVMSDRPKREAAVIGFASLVAANLNNTGVSVNSTPETPDTLNVRSETGSLPSPSVSVSYTEHQHQQQQQGSTVEVLATKPVVAPRGRGRPPKIKPTHLLNTNSTLSPNTEKSENKPETIIGHRKRSVLFQSRGSSPLITSSSIICSQLPEGDNIPNHQQQQQQPQVYRNEHESRQQHETTTATTTTTEVPTDNSAVLKEVDNNDPSSNNPTDSSLPSLKLSKISTKQTNKKRLMPTSNVKTKLSEIHSTGQNTSSRLGIHSSSSTSVSQISSSINQKSDRLPSRNSFFKDSLISSLDQISFLKDKSLTGPLYELFCRFFNEPDPLEPNYRLCSPIIYLPSPERYPEFYRFTLSSHLSGSGLQVKFTTGFINRLFSPISFPSSDNDNRIMDDEIYNIELPSLCLASIASRFVMNNNNNNSTEENMTDSTSIVGVVPLNLELSEAEENSYKIVTNSTDFMESLHILDICMDNIFSVWEAFTGRRSWFGRRLSQLKSVYVKHRTDMVECLKLQNCLPVAMPKSLVPAGSKFQNSTTKKKADRRALERGAEVIRCLCGFRVEGGHVMVQCDRCASWQHLPCLWWALSLAIRNDTNDGRNSNLACLCQTALIAAQAVGSTGEGNDVKSEGGGGSADREADAPYICPVCLKLDNLTKEYPRSLSAAMSLNDLDAVFDLQDTLVKGEHEFWTLGSPDGTCQIRTDDYAFVNRFWLDHLNTSQDISKGIIPSVHIKELLEQSQRTPVKSAYDRVIVRIYRLWKDVDGFAWLEGGLFLRPYDIPQPSRIDSPSKCPQAWHSSEVVYDEARRVILPLNAWIGRCTVLCPSAYRVGRPADLLCREHIQEFLPTVKNCNESNNSNKTSTGSDEFQHFFVCEKLFEQPSSTGNGQGFRFDEISPGYLKVNMKPYCFLRKADNQCIRGGLPRQYSASDLLTQDQIPFTTMEKPTVSKTSEEQHPLLSSASASSSSVQRSSNNEEEKNPAPAAFGSSKQKGEKLARVVDWLERKRQTGALQQTNAMLSLQSTSLENEIPSIAAAATAPPPPLSPILSRFSAPQPSCVVPVKNDVDDDTEMRDLSTSIEVSSPTSRGKGRFGTPTKSLKSLRSPLGAELTPKKSSSSTSSQNDTADISTKKSPKLENINVLEGNTDGNDSLGIASSDHVTSERTASPSTISENITPISPSRNSNNNKDEENTRINSPNIQITPAHNETSPVSSCSLFKPELQNEDSSLDDSLVKSVSSTSQLTSPTLSTTTDDHSNISLSPGAGSSRKRKRPVTRKRLIHEPELLPPGVEMISDDSSTCITTTTTPHHHQIAELNTGRSIDEENLGGSSTSTANNNNNGQNMDESSSDKDLLSSTGVIVDQASEEHYNNKPCMHTCQSHLMLEYETCCLDIQPLGMMNLPSTEVIAETSCLSSVYEKPIIISDHHHEEPEQQQQSECIDDPMTSPDTTELSNIQPDIMDDSQVNSVKNNVVVISSEMVSTDNLDKRLDDETEVTKSPSKLQPDEEEEVGNNDDDDHEEEDEVLDCSKTTRGLYDIEMFIPPSKDSEVVSSAAVTVPSSVPLSNENNPNSCVSIDKEELPPPTNEAMSSCMNISMLSSISDEEMIEPSTTNSIVDISPSKSSPLPPTITAASAAAPPPIHEKESKTLTKFAVETLVSDDYPTTSSATSNLLNLSYISSPDEDDGDDIASEKDSKDSPQLNTITASTNDDDEMVMTTNTVEKLDVTTTTATTDMNKSLPESSDDNRCIITTDGNDDPMAQVGDENSISEQSIHPTISSTTKDDEATAVEFMSTTVSPSHPGTPLLDEKSDPLEQTTSDFDTITSNTISIISNPECLQLITNSHEVIDAYTHTTTGHSSSSTPSSSSLASSSIVSKQQNLEILMKKSRDCSTTPRKDTEDTMVKKSKDSSRDYNRHYEAVATADRHHHSPSSSHSYYQSKSSSNFNHYKSQSYSNNNNSNNPRYDRKHHYPHPSHQHQQHSYRQHQHHSHQLKDSSNNSSHRRDDYNSRYRDTPSSSSSLLHRSRDHDDKNSSAYSSSSRHNHHNERSSSSHSSSSHRHQDSIYSTSHRDSS